MPQTFLPWSILLYVAIWQSIKAFKIDRRRVFFFCWLVAPFVLLSLSAGKRPSYLLMIYPAAAAFLADFIVALAASTSPRTERVARWLAAMQATIVSGALGYVLVRLVQIHLPAVAALSLALAVPPLYFMWRSLPELRVLRFLAGAVGALLVTFVAYYGLVTPHDGERQSARRVMDQLAVFADAGHPVALYLPTERMRGAASFYLQRRVPTLATPEQTRAALVRQPDLVVLADDSVRFDPALFAEQAKVPYGKSVYRYWSGTH